MNEQTWKTLGIVSVIVVVLAGLVLVANGRLEIPGMPRADNGAVRVQNGGKDTCDDFGTRGIGIFPSPPGKSLGGIFANYVVHYSFLKDGRSLAIVGQAGYVTCSSVWSPASESFYVFDINNGLGFQPLRINGLPTGRLTFAENGGTWVGSGTYKLSAFSFQIPGFRFCAQAIPASGGCPAEADIKDGAVLRVTMGYDFPLLLGGTCCDPDKYLVRDELTLRSAYATVKWDEDGYDVATDTVATFTWRAPTATYSDCDGADCTERPAYVITAFDDNTGTPLEGWDRKPIPTADGRGEVALSPDLFSKNLETCKNTLTVVIYTEIAEIAQDWAGLSDSADLGAPAGEVTSVKITPAEIRQGDVVTVSWTFAGNATSFVVKVEINGVLVLDEYQVPASERSITFTASSAGYGHAGVAAKSFCQVGEFKKIYFSVGPVYYGLCNLFPGNAACATASLLAWALAIVALILVVLVALFVLWVLDKLGIEDLPPWARLLIVFLAAAGAAALFLWLGWFDVFLGV